MTKKRIKLSEEEDLTACWSAPADEYLVNQNETFISKSSAIVLAQGKKGAYRLDFPVMQAQLLSSYQLIETKYEAMGWIATYDLPAGGTSNKINDVIASAASLRALIQLESVTKKVLRLGNQSDLETLLIEDTDNNMLFKDLSHVFYADGGRFIKVDIQPIYFEALKGKTKKKREEFLFKAAHRYLSFAANVMIMGVQPSVFWDYDPIQREVLRQTFLISYPWQAIGLAFIELMRERALNLKYCSNPNCNKPLINKRSDSRSCGESICRHYVERRLPAIREYAR